MKGWLTKLAEQPKSEDEVLHDTIETMPQSALQELLYDLDPTTRPTQMDDMQDKIAEASRIGRELAQEHGDTLAKEAGVLQMGLGALKGFATGGAGGALMGAAKEGVKDAVSSGVKSTVARGISSAARSPMAAPAAGGFNYGKVAGVMNTLGGFAQRAAGYAVRNPGTAATLAGAGAGALMAPRDPQTGEKQYLRGAVMGGGLAAGANALTQGAIGNRMRKAVMNRESPLLGQKTRSYFMDAARATKGNYKPAASVGPSAAAAASEYRGGPTMGQVKVGFLLGGIAGHMAAGPNRDASPRSGFWRGTGGGLLGTIAGANIGKHLAGAKGYYGGALLGDIAGGILAGRTARPSEDEIYAHHQGEVAKHKAMVDRHKEKKANMQRLVYDPATKTFTRQHLTPDTTMGEAGTDVIPAGHTEPVLRGPAGRGQYAGQVAPAGAPPSGGMSQTHVLHGGNVLSSSPRPGVAARAASMPPPIPAAARRPMGGVAGLAGAAAKPTKLPSLAGAVSLVGKK